jgi:hypothetical protein
MNSVPRYQICRLVDSMTEAIDQNALNIGRPVVDSAAVG